MSYTTVTICLLSVGNFAENFSTAHYFFTISYNQMLIHNYLPCSKVKLIQCILNMQLKKVVNSVFIFFKL